MRMRCLDRTTMCLFSAAMLAAIHARGVEGVHSRPERARSPGPRMQQLDEDGDGRVSRGEGHGLGTFDAMDADADGFITAELIRAFSRSRWRPGLRARRAGLREELPHEGRSGALGRIVVPLTGPADLTVRGEPVRRGFVIADGRDLPPPFVVQWAEGSLRVNGVPVRTEHGILGLDEGVGADDSVWGPWAVVNEVEHLLSSGCMLLSQENTPATVLTPDVAFGAFAILLSTQDSEERSESLAAMQAFGVSTEAWRALAHTFEASPDLPRRVDELSDTLRSACSTPGVGPRAAHGLALVGMVLTVAALGTLLQSRVPNGEGWRGAAVSRAATGLAVRCVVLLVLLSGFDVLATLLTQGASGLYEMNPIASARVPGTMAALVCRTSFVGLGAVVLYALRTRRLVQRASWWLCVAYTVLLVRWVGLNSLFLM